MAYRRPLPGGGLPQSQTNRAGASLGTASARAQFGHAADIGASGERYFASIVQREGLDVVCDAFYSLSIPRGRDRSAPLLKSDVDAVLVNGNKVILIDVKRWKGNTVYWSLSGLPFTGLTPLQHGGQWKMSGNMAQALRRYREALPGVNVMAMVVFVPTERGNAPTSVRWLKWPGGIRSYLLPAAVKHIRDVMGHDREIPSAKVIGTLNALQR